MRFSRRFMLRLKQSKKNKKYYILSPPCPPQALKVQRFQGFLLFIFGAHNFFFFRNGANGALFCGALVFV